MCRAPVSIHAPRAGRDPPALTLTSPKPGFQSTRPARGATASMVERIILSLFQSTRPARGATVGIGGNCGFIGVSIHAPRAGRDGLFPVSIFFSCCFNPRAPRGARRGVRLCIERARMFQSTRPARGATILLPQWLPEMKFQSTRPARGATILLPQWLPEMKFQSTRPARGATGAQGELG